MEVLKIVIQSLKDVSEGKQLIEGLHPEIVKETKDLTIAIQEHGTVGGQTTLMFLLKNADGTYSMAQITATHFEGLVAAYNGANARFEIEKV